MAPTSAPVRVLVVDSQPLFALGVAAALRSESDAWVQVADSSPERLTGTEGADVLVVGIDGDVPAIWSVCDQLVSLAGGVEVAFVLMLPGRSEFEMTAAASSGAAAVLPRSATPTAIRDAVTAVAAGRTLVAPGMSERMLHDFAGMLRRRRQTAEADLTARELQVLELVAEGRTNHAIAAALHISENTVKNHVRHILTKLGAASRTEAVAVAARSGLLIVGQGLVGPAGTVRARPSRA